MLSMLPALAPLALAPLALAPLALVPIPTAIAMEEPNTQIPNAQISNAQISNAQIPNAQIPNTQSLEHHHQSPTQVAQFNPTPINLIANWSDTAATYRGYHGQQIWVACIPGGALGSVWGTRTYTDDSSICTAAVHAGLIDMDAGGNVMIEITPGEIAYEGTTQNGVTSTEWGNWDGSFIFVENNY